MVLYAMNTRYYLRSKPPEIPEILKVINYSLQKLALASSVEVPYQGDWQSSFI
jgi:hypothetical protein